MARRAPPIATGKQRLMERLRAKSAAELAPSTALAELSLAVVGARFDNPLRKGKPTGNRQSEILMCEPGETVTLEHEPKNLVDGKAIAVVSSRGVQIGYIVADRTVLIHKAWEAARDVRAVFQEAITGGAAIRVAFDRDPVLPPPSKRLPPQPAAGEWDGVDYIPPDD